MRLGKKTIGGAAIGLLVMVVAAVAVYRATRPTILELAAEGRHDELREQLERNPILAHDVEDEDGHKVMHYAGSAETVELLREYRVPVNATDDDGYTPLHIAQKPDVVEALIKHGADVNATNDREKYTPLHCYVNEFIGGGIIWSDEVRIERIRLLLDNGAAINQQDRYGRTPLDYAVNDAVVDYLISRGAKTNKP